MKKLFLLLGILVGLVLLIYFLDENKVQLENQLFISGNIEVTDVDASFKIPGRLIKRYVDEGDIVKKGDMIGRLDPKELREEVKRAEAEKNRAKAFLEEKENGFLPEEIREAIARVDQAQAQFVRTEMDHKRQITLFEEEVISKKEYDQSEAQYLIAKAQLEEAKEQLIRLERGSRYEEIKQAQEQLLTAEASLEVTKTRLEDSIIFSPLNGVVLTKIVEPGEVVAAGEGIVNIGDLQDIWFRAYIPETELGRVKLGQEVAVTTDSYPDKKYLGIVTFIASEAEFTPKNVQTKKERVKLVFRIKVTLENPLSELKPGMPADGWILLDEAQPTIGDS